MKKNIHITLVASLLGVLLLIKGIQWGISQYDIYRKSRGLEQQGWEVMQIQKYNVLIEDDGYRYRYEKVFEDQRKAIEAGGFDLKVYCSENQNAQQVREVLFKLSVPNSEEYTNIDSIVAIYCKASGGVEVAWIEVQFKKTLGIWYFPITVTKQNVLQTIVK